MENLQTLSNLTISYDFRLCKKYKQKNKNFNVTFLQFSSLSDQWRQIADQRSNVWTAEQSTNFDQWISCPRQHFIKCLILLTDRFARARSKLGVLFCQIQIESWLEFHRKRPNVNQWNIIAQPDSHCQWLSEREYKRKASNTLVLSCLRLSN